MTKHLSYTLLSVDGRSRFVQPAFGVNMSLSAAQVKSLIVYQLLLTPHRYWNALACRFCPRDVDLKYATAALELGESTQHSQPPHLATYRISLRDSSQSAMAPKRRHRDKAQSNGDVKPQKRTKLQINRSERNSKTTLRIVSTNTNQTRLARMTLPPPLPVRRPPQAHKTLRQTPRTLPSPLQHKSSRP